MTKVKYLKHGCFYASQTKTTKIHVFISAPNSNMSGRVPAAFLTILYEKLEKPKCAADGLVYIPHEFTLIIIS